MAGNEWLTHDHFAGREGQRFGLTDGPELVLVQTTLGDQPGGRGPTGEERLQFSLVFGGPGDQALSQGTYALTHPELGELHLFLVPIGQGEEGIRYEAAFA